MPTRFKKTAAGGTNYGNPIVGTPNGVTHIKLDISTMTHDTGSGGEVDDDGHLRPGVLLDAGGTSLGSSEVAYGVVMEAIKVTDDPTALGSEVDPLIAVCTIGLINRDIAEDNLGRAYTANELAALTAAGSTLKVTST